MTARATFKPNRKSVAVIAKSRAATDLTHSAATRIAAAAGVGFEVNTRRGKSRAVSSVHSATYEARIAEHNDRALTRAIDAGRF
jgi:hypothetical protein